MMCLFQGMPPAALTDDEAFLEPSGSQSDRKTSLSISNLDILSVNQLLESVRQTFYGAPVFKFLFNHPIYVNPSILHLWNISEHWMIVNALFIFLSFLPPIMNLCLLFSSVVLLTVCIIYRCSKQPDKLQASQFLPHLFLTIK